MANVESFELQGKRSARRRENAQFSHNPHIAPPTSLDLAHPLQLPAATFPHPLPACLPRSVPVPPARIPPSVPSTSSAGLFSLSLRGVRRTLRARPSSAPLVKAIDAHLATWLHGGTYLNPDQSKGLLRFPGDPVGGREDIREVGREAGRLVWAVKAGAHDGAFERYVVHCVARWYGVVSFSKETEGHRLTYLLRPNITRPDPRISAAFRTLDTPPTTDASDGNVTDVSDIDSVSGDAPGTHALYDIQESRPSSPDSWSVLGGSDFTVDLENDAEDPGFAASMESLSLSAHGDMDDFSAALATDGTTPQNAPQDESRADEAEPGGRGGNSATLRARVDQSRLRALYPRSASSPSPVRRASHRLHGARGGRKRRANKNNKGLAGAMGSDKGTFYDYLYA